MDESQKNSENVSLNWFDRVMQRLFGVIVFESSDKALSKASAKDVLTLYGASVMKYPMTVCILIIFTILASTLSVIAPIWYKDFFDIASTSPQNGATGEKLLGVIYIILGINLVMWFAKQVGHYAEIRLAREVMTGLRI